MRVLVTTDAPSLTRHGLGFLARANFAGVPTVRPFIGLQAIASGCLEPQSTNWWWFATLLLGLSWIITRHLASGVGATARIVVVWRVFRGAPEDRRAIGCPCLLLDVGAGLLVGFAVALALDLYRTAD